MGVNCELSVSFISTSIGFSGAKLSPKITKNAVWKEKQTNPQTHNKPKPPPPKPQTLIPTSLCFNIFPCTKATTWNGKKETASMVRIPSDCNALVLF